MIYELADGAGFELCKCDEPASARARDMSTYELFCLGQVLRRCPLQVCAYACDEHTLFTHITHPRCALIAADSSVAQYI